MCNITESIAQVLSVVPIDLGIKTFVSSRTANLQCTNQPSVTDVTTQRPATQSTKYILFGNQNQVKATARQNCSYAPYWRQI